MPRSGPNGTYTLPGAQDEAQPNTTIQSSINNQGWADIEQTFNTVQPIPYGGTGQTDLVLPADKFGIKDSVDDSKKVAFDISSLSAATTRTLTVPDKSGIIATMADVTSATANVAQKVDTRRNRIVNHDMRMSQENGTTAGTVNGYYAADQWATYHVTSAGTITSAQVASVTPAGSPNRYRVTITTPDASLAAGEYLTISQNLEGSNVVDFQYGGANAKASVLRFGFKGPAGTYAVALHNSAANRSFVATFTVGAGEANTDTVQEIAIPGDTTGTWLTADGVIGITLDIVLACGSTFQGSAGWQSGNILGTSAVSNGMATGSAVFELFDVGLRLDPDATGVYGQYEVGGADAVFRPERYLWRLDALASGQPLGFMGMSGSDNNNFDGQLTFPIQLAKPPSVSASASSTFTARYSAGSGGITERTLVTGPTIANATTRTATVAGTHSSAANGAGYLLFNTTPAFIQFSARLS